MSITRCPWVPVDNPLYISYHDCEWGVPLHDDCKLFELIVLEGAQAGLSWITVLKKREEYRRIYQGFNPQSVAKFGDIFISSCLANSGIIRNKLKILSSLVNARVVCAIQKEFGSFDRYLWRFTHNSVPIQHSFQSLKEYPTSSAESDALSHDLRKRGMKFVGTTICYAFMQSIGMVNDHTINCFRYKEICSLETKPHS